MSRFARRVDANHVEVVERLRALGCQVHSTAALGQGFPDLLVCLAGRLRLVEVKDGAKAPSKRRLTEAEARFAGRWPVALVETAADVDRLVAEWRAEAPGRPV